jgi:hypothetical protein
LHLGSNPGYGDKAWPFDPPKPPGRDIVIAPGADSGFKTVKKTSVTANGKAVHVKYDVEVGSGASAVKEDPIVIIEK